ncbi:MAG: flagellar motor protein MotA [Bacteroidales bacterium 45-6]|nr:MAG: flagellar motor protein MotA [Bacteroidales bacterium 45-6]
MNLLTIFLQATATLTEAPHPKAIEESYFDLLMKGGWILVPIFLLSLLSIYVIINRTLVIRKLGQKDALWFSRVWELVQEKKIDKAVKFSLEKQTATSRVIAAGLKEIENEDKEIEESMQMEARMQISLLENQMNYLGITAAIAPMLGFLGTIFGVIKIFYNISVSGDLNIASISDGLYQKMICSGAGLFVGIIAYAGYYVLNGFIDKAVLTIDKDSNEMLKAIRTYKKGNETAA